MDVTWQFLEVVLYLAVMVGSYCLGYYDANQKKE
jgi:hypothetical protein